MRLSRPGIGLSLLLHALVIGGAMRAVWHLPRRSSPPPLQAAIVWFAPDLAPAPPPTEERPASVEPTIDGAGEAPHTESPSGRDERSEPRSRTRRQEPAIAPAQMAPATPLAATAPGSAPAQDLFEARRRAAADVVEGTARADAHRSFEFPGTIAQQRAFDESERFRRHERGLGAPLTVFDSPAKGRAGLPEETPRGIGVVWVSDDCYVFREPLDRFILRDVFVPPKTCTRRLARTDLFATAKPYYLMRDEERTEVDAETQRRELLRRPTTGAVMPIGND